MPIKDRTRRRLVRLGTIRLGKQVPNSSGEGTHPVQTDYFVLKDAPEIAEVYGEKPRELDVLLPFPDILRNFDANYQVWAGGVLVCQGDGEYVQYATPHRVTEDKRGTHVYNDTGDTLVSNGVAQTAFDWNGTHFEPGELVACPGADKDLYPHCAACKLNGLLKVMMARPELFRMGFYQISTGSKRNYDTIMGMLEAMGVSDFRGIEFKLRLAEESITYVDAGKRKKATKWFLQLEPDPEDTRAAYKRLKQRTLGAPALLPPEQTYDGPEWDDTEPPEPPPYAVDSVEEAQYIAAAEVTNGAIDGEVVVVAYTPVPMPDKQKGGDALAKKAAELFDQIPDVGTAMTILYRTNGPQWKSEPPVVLWDALNTWFMNAAQESAKHAAEAEEE